MRRSCSCSVAALGFSLPVAREGGAGDGGLSRPRDGLWTPHLQPRPQALAQVELAMGRSFITDLGNMIKLDFILIYFTTCVFVCACAFIFFRVFAC